MSESSTSPLVFTKEMTRDHPLGLYISKGEDQEGGARPYLYLMSPYVHYTATGEIRNDRLVTNFPSGIDQAAMLERVVNYWKIHCMFYIEDVPTDEVCVYSDLIVLVVKLLEKIKVDPLWSNPNKRPWTNEDWAAATVFDYYFLNNFHPFGDEEVLTEVIKYNIEHKDGTGILLAINVKTTRSSFHIPFPYTIDYFIQKYREYYTKMVLDELNWVANWKKDIMMEYEASESFYSANGKRSKPSSGDVRLDLWTKKLISE
jgi:hypothetical protein